MNSTTDRIEKQIVLQASLARVWRAITDATEFGAWFGVDLAGEFAPGERVPGKITVPGYEQFPFEIRVERMEPEQLFSYRWNPCAYDPLADDFAKHSTLVEFRLEAVDAGTRLAIVESGFDRLPADRRTEVFGRNEGGWTQQVLNIERHVGTV